MATITKRDLVVEIADTVGITQQQVFKILQHFLDNVTSHLAAQNEVVLRNFGTFEIRMTKAKVGRNPNAPEKDVPIPPRAVVKFKPGKEMKEKVAQLLPTLLSETKGKGKAKAKAKSE
ncbi:MAG: HU family DNA-binding protein [Verrucomicrobiales bacterium]|nr:HU family DNA-binding protein [Verrucomicrobiales bacterium]